MEAIDRFGCVVRGGEEVEVAAACVDDIVTREIEGGEKLLDDFFGDEFKVEASGPEGFECAFGGDGVDEVLDAGEVACDQAKTIGVGLFGEGSGDRAGDTNMIDEGNAGVIAAETGGIFF